MKIAPKMNGFALAAAAATMLLAAPLSAVAGDSAKGHCMGVNSCKGTSACKTSSNSCKGQNSCKGKGFLEESKASCDKAGGTYEAAPAK